MVERGSATRLAAGLIGRGDIEAIELREHRGEAEAGDLPEQTLVTKNPTPRAASPSNETSSAETAIPHARQYAGPARRILRIANAGSNSSRASNARQ